MSDVALDEYLFGCAIAGLPDLDSAGSPFGGTAVYRFFAIDGDLLYVGTTNSISVRWNDHAAAKAWYADVHHMTVVWYKDKAAAEAVELTPLERLIDEATGHDKARLAEAEEIIAEIKKLKAEWDALPGAPEE